MCFTLQSRVYSDHKNKLQKLKLLMLGQKTYGKSATGNNLLRKEVFATCENEHCQAHEAEVAGRMITVIDTPGWWKKSSDCTIELDKEIVRGLSLSPSGVHAVLLAVPLDLTFREVQQIALEEHMNLFDASIWKHTMVLFTYGDKLADKSVEEHIEGEHRALRWLVSKCENKYHMMNNKKNDMNQVTELFEKIEEMVAGNNGQLFCPDMYNVHLRIEEKFKKKQLQHVLKQRLMEQYKKRELELLIGFRDTLSELQDEIRGSVRSTKSLPLGKYLVMRIRMFFLHFKVYISVIYKWFIIMFYVLVIVLVDNLTKLKNMGFGQKKKDHKEKEEHLDARISLEIEKLGKEIMKSTEFLQSSKDFLIPDCKQKLYNNLKHLSQMEQSRFMFVFHLQ